MIKVKFLGYRVKEKRGCPVCGNRTTSNNETVKRRQVINIPNGRRITFIFGNEYSVTESEWEYLSQIPKSFIKV